MTKAMRKVLQLRRRFHAAYREWVAKMHGVCVGSGERRVEASTIINREVWSTFLREVFRGNLDLSYSEWLCLSKDAAQECCNAFARAEMLYEYYWDALQQLAKREGVQIWELPKRFWAA